MREMNLIAAGEQTRRKSLRVSNLLVTRVQIVQKPYMEKDR